MLALPHRRQTTAAHAIAGRGESTPAGQIGVGAGDLRARPRALEQDLAALREVQAEVQSAAEPEPFAAQVELGIRINQVLRDWLPEQIKASAADTGRR